MATQIGNMAVGSTVYLNESGSPVPYLIVHQGLPSSMYASSCNGTWLLRQDILENRVWDSGDDNMLDTATLQIWLNSTMLDKFDHDIQEVIKSVSIPYCVGGSKSTVNSGAHGLSCRIFLLSGYEIGWSTSISSTLPIDGAQLGYFLFGTGSSANEKRIANLNGDPNYWWLRSPRTSSSTGVWVVYSDGSDYHEQANSRYGVRPALIMPTDLIVDDDGNILTAPPTPVLTAPSNAMQGQPIPVSWTASESADSYTLQRKADSGEWETVYTGANLQYQDTAGSWSTVQYQVAASADGVFSDYAQSAVIPVISASALVISGSDEDLGVITRDIPYTVTSDTGNEITLVRTVNGQQVDSRTVQSGFSYNIPVLDLPTGKGTIEITASVQVSGGPVTAKRTWQYEKTALQWPNAGGVGQLTQNGKNVFPLTLAEAVRTAGGVGLDKILEQLVPLIDNGAKIEVGSYVGTGTYGEDNPNVITTTIENAKIMFLWTTFGNDSKAVPSVASMMLVEGKSTNFTAVGQVNSGSTTDNLAAGSGFVKKIGKQISWHGDSARRQGNVAGKQAYYVIIG